MAARAVHLVALDTIIANEAAPPPCRRRLRVTESHVRGRKTHSLRRQSGGVVVCPGATRAVRQVEAAEGLSAPPGISAGTSNSPRMIVTRSGALIARRICLRSI